MWNVNRLVSILTGDILTILGVSGNFVLYLLLIVDILATWNKLSPQQRGHRVILQNSVLK